MHILQSICLLSNINKNIKKIKPPVKQREGVGVGDTDGQDHLKVFIEVDQDRTSTRDTVATTLPEQRQEER